MQNQRLGTAKTTNRVTSFARAGEAASLPLRRGLNEPRHGLPSDVFRLSEAADRRPTALASLPHGGSGATRKGENPHPGITAAA